MGCKGPVHAADDSGIVTTGTKGSGRAPSPCAGAVQAGARRGDLGNLARVVARSASATAAWDRKFQGGVRRRSQRIQPIMVYGGGDRAGAVLDAQQRLTGVIEAFEVDVLDGGQVTTVFELVYRCIAEDIADFQQIGGLDDMGLALDPDGERPGRAGPDVDVRVAQSCHGESLRGCNGPATIGTGGDGASPSGPIPARDSARDPVQAPADREAR